MAKPFCPACYPLKVRSHRNVYFEDFLDIFLTRLYASGIKAQLPRFPTWLSLTYFWYRIMELLRIVRFTSEFEKKDHWPRSWAVIEEARRRGIQIESILILGRVSTYYRMKFGSKYYYFDSLPSRFLHFRLDEKAYVKKKLLKAGFPASEGKLFWNVFPAMHYGKKLGFPLVVKPARGTHAYHVTAPINNEEELRRAITLAKQYQPRFIVERYLTGQLYRVTVINFHHVYVARRIAPNVVGDGVHTVDELIEIKNSDPARGETGQRDTTLHKIPVNGATDAALLRLGLTHAYIPKKDEQIVLHSKTSIGSGGDIFEETALLHPENKEMFRRAARLFGTDLVGFDVIATDLGRPYTEQVCGIIEANSIPMIDFHHYPSFGPPQNAAGALLDGIVADKRVRYLYPVMLPQRSLGTRLMWHLIDIIIPLMRPLVEGWILPWNLKRRQPFSVGWIRRDTVPEAAITHLKMNGFEVVRPGWLDRGEIIGLRKLLDHERQCHVRFFDDGEVRAHVEYAPEARPIAHLLEQGFHAAHDIMHALLHQYLEHRELRLHSVPEIAR